MSFSNPFQSLMGQIGSMGNLPAGMGLMEFADQLKSAQLQASGGDAMVKAVLDLSREPAYGTKPVHHVDRLEDLLEAEWKLQEAKTETDSSYAHSKVSGALRYVRGQIEAYFRSTE